MFRSTCVILSLRHTGQGPSHKILYSYGHCNHRVAWGTKVKV